MANPTAPTVPGAAGRPVVPAPAVRTRPARPEKRPEIKLSAAKEESRFIGPLPLAIGVIALAATLGFAHRVSSKIEDPNYVQAKESLGQYELGRTETEKNYDSPIYADALDALAKVDPGSISTDKAAALVADIKFKTDAFHRRINARTEAEKAFQDASIDRNREYLAAYQRDLLTKKKDYPECKEGEGEHEH